MTDTDRPTARLSDSHTELTELLMPDDTNFRGRALGGVVLHWMDIAGAIAAMRFTNRECVTASMDHVDFISPIDVGEVAVVQAYVFDTGGTSLDVKVDVLAEDPVGGDEREATSSFLTFVALNEEGKPTEVPELACKTDAEQQHREVAIQERQEHLEAIVEQME